ncbi:chemotaxis protein CheD [Longirhabdus pacifica]|uniref:chemotaxis protein CheD n=1 Tax=Longirhabdus pacifica TaxID=2305227 RepID=UPI001008E1E3|nr:chemotaxis protein CheD [Longirhabdus pacifica]
MNEKTVIRVGMAELKIATSPHILRTSGLGSCVGMALYDASERIGGMVHIMLPTSKIARETDPNPAKYADLAVPKLMDELIKFGAKPSKIKAKLAGGAQMFAFKSESEMIKIGLRNVEMCHNLLKQMSIPIEGEDVGGNSGRTIELHMDTGKLTISTANKLIKEL